MRRCAANEPLPDGMDVKIAYDASTCVLTGTADSVQDATTITITATNAVSSSTASVDITVTLPTPFITTWKTDNDGGISDDNQITLQTAPGMDYDFTVDWGDGSTDTNVTADITHNYAQAGTYTVTITGTYPQPYFAVDSESFEINSDAPKLLTVEQWVTDLGCPWRKAFLVPNTWSLTTHNAQI